MPVKKKLKWKNDDARVDYLNARIMGGSGYRYLEITKEDLLLIRMDTITVTCESYAVQYDCWDVDLGTDAVYYLCDDEIYNFFDMVEG